MKYNNRKWVMKEIMFKDFYNDIHGLLWDQKVTSLPDALGDVNGQMRKTEKEMYICPKADFLLYLYAVKWYKNIGYFFICHTFLDLLSGECSKVWECI